jgi:hypothetical protein
MSEQSIEPNFMKAAHIFSIASSFIITNLCLMPIKQPILNLQIKKQINPDLSNLQNIKNIYSSEGLKGFYKAIPVSSFKILVTEIYRGPLIIFTPKYIEDSLKLNSHYQKDLLSGLIATPIIASIDSTIICPLNRLSTHQQTATQKASLKNIVTCYMEKSILKETHPGDASVNLQNTIKWSAFLKELYSGYSAVLLQSTIKLNGAHFLLLMI